jgi:hypothetical protein
MSRKNSNKPYCEMTTEQLRQATEEFDEEFVADKAKPSNLDLQAQWERAKAKLPGVEDGQGQQTIAVRVEKALLDRCTALARKKRISRDALISRGLRALLAAEGEGIDKGT